MIVSQTSPVLLRMFLASIFAYVDVRVKQGQLFCDRLCDSGPLYPGQVRGGEGGREGREGGREGGRGGEGGREGGRDEWERKEGTFDGDRGKECCYLKINGQEH